MSLDQKKPRSYWDARARLWKCQLDFTAGQGTTRRGAWDVMWEKLALTHPHLTKPEATR